MNHASIVEDVEERQGREGKRERERERERERSRNAHTDIATVK